MPRPILHSKLLHSIESRPRRYGYFRARHRARWTHSPMPRRRSLGRPAAPRLSDDQTRPRSLGRRTGTRRLDYHPQRPPFLTRMALSWQARPAVFLRQIQRRREFLERELAREKKAIKTVRLEVGHDSHEAVWMITLMLGQFQT